MGVFVCLLSSRSVTRLRQLTFSHAPWVRLSRFPPFPSALHEPVLAKGEKRVLSLLLLLHRHQDGGGAAAGFGAGRSGQAAQSRAGEAGEVLGRSAERDRRAPRQA